MLSVALASISGAIANVALPTIAKDLGVSPATSIWVISSYQIALGALILPMSSLGEIFSYRRVYRVGLLVFTLASLLCAFTHSLPILIVGRMLQGVGAAGVVSLNTVITRFTYPRAMLGRGIGLNSVLVATSTAAGPSVAAAILAVADWPWLFLVNVPLGGLAFILSRWIPVTKGSGHPFDVRSAVLNAVALGGLILGIDEIGRGEATEWAILAIIAAVISGIFLVRRQETLKAPMLATDLLKNPAMSLAVTTSGCSYAAQWFAFVSLPFFFQDVMGQSQIATGLLMTPWPVTVMAISPLVGRLSDRYPAGVLCSIGAGIMSLGLILLAFLPDQASSLDISWRMVIAGIGFGVFQTPNNRSIIMSAPPERSGGAGGLLALGRMIGQATGAALVALIFGLCALNGASQGTAVVLALLAGAGFAGAGSIASALRSLSRKPAEA